MSNAQAIAQQAADMNREREKTTGAVAVTESQLEAAIELLNKVGRPSSSEAIASLTVAIAINRLTASRS